MVFMSVCGVWQFRLCTVGSHWRWNGQRQAWEASRAGMPVEKTPSPPQWHTEGLSSVPDLGAEMLRDTKETREGE